MSALMPIPLASGPVYRCGVRATLGHAGLNIGPKSGQFSRPLHAVVVTKVRTAPGSERALRQKRQSSGLLVKNW
jgi:hypothetical protein